MSEGTINCPECDALIELPLSDGSVCPNCGTNLKEFLAKLEADVSARNARLKALRKAMSRSERLKEQERWKSMTYVMRTDWINRIAEDAEHKNVFAKTVVDEIMESYWKWLRPAADKAGMTVLAFVEHLLVR